jgi:hypothetical protein
MQPPPICVSTNGDVDGAASVALHVASPAQAGQQRAAPVHRVQADAAAGLYHVQT